MGDNSPELFCLYSFIRASSWASQLRNLRWLFAFDLVIVFNISIQLLKKRIIARLSKDGNTSRWRNGYKAKQREFRAKCGRCHVDVRPMWGRCQADVGSMLGRYQVDVRSMSGRCGTGVMSVWDPFKADLESLRGKESMCGDSGDRGTTELWAQFSISKF